MKFFPTVLAITSAAAVALCATAATAFTVGPQGHGLSTRRRTQQQSISANRNCLGGAFLRMNTDDFAKSEIESNDVVVFSKSYCPFCTATKKLFSELGVDFKVHELDQMGDDGPALQMSLFKMTEQRTVPNVFVKGQHIGGNDNTQAAAKEGKLQEMLGIAA